MCAGSGARSDSRFRRGGGTLSDALTGWYIDGERRPVSGAAVIGTGTDSGEGIGVLRGWKEIAQYLRTSERTATRWSVEKALPVHRSGHGALVVAYRSELDSWQREMAGTAASLSDAPESPRPATDAALRSTGRRRRLMTAMFVVGVLVVMLGLVSSDGLARLKNLVVPRGDEQALVGSHRFLVRLEPVGVAPVDLVLTDGGTATVDFPGQPTLRLKVRKNGTGVIVTVAEQTTADGLSQSGSETILELQEHARVSLKQPFPLVLTWRREDAGGPAR